MKPKLLYDNPFILGNIIKKKLKVLAGGDIDQYLEGLASETIKKRVSKKPQVRFTAEVWFMWCKFWNVYDSCGGECLEGGIM